MPMLFFRLQQPDEHRDDDLVNGAHAEEKCAVAEEAGLPSASTASATWLSGLVATRTRIMLALAHSE
jgi:hypothetical protein